LLLLRVQLSFLGLQDGKFKSFASNQLFHFASWADHIETRVLTFQRLNLLGLTAGLCVVASGIAQMIETTIGIRTNYESSPDKTVGILIAILISWIIVNAYARGILKYLPYIGIFLNTVGTTVLSIAILAKASPNFNSASFVFKKFIDDTGVNGADGWSIRASPALVACMGCAPTQYLLNGYDLNAHLAEETRRPSWYVSLGMVLSVSCSIIIGFFLLLALLFSMDDVDKVLNTPTGQPFLQVMVDIFGIDWAVVLFSFIIITAWLGGLFTLTAASRLVYALSRDGGLVSIYRDIQKTGSNNLVALLLKHSQRKILEPCKISLVRCTPRFLHVSSFFRIGRRILGCYVYCWYRAPPLIWYSNQYSNDLS
jgi:amino acid transporter